MVDINWFIRIMDEWNKKESLMGCWSESCAVSGMEIRCGNSAYVVGVVRNKYGEGWDVAFPPIKGEYDDYGGLVLFESNAQFDLTEGDDFRPMDSDLEGSFIFIDAGVFEFLEQLEPEFPYFYGEESNSVKVKSIGESCDMGLAELIKKIDAEKSKCDEMNKLLAAAIEKNSDIADFPMRGYSIFGNHESVVGSMTYIERKFANNDFDFDEFLMFYRRAKVFNSAIGELRKSVAIGIRGPQHGGEVALTAFYKHVTMLLERNNAEDAKEAEDG